MVPLLELQSLQQMATLYFFRQRPVVIEVLYSCSGSAHRMGLLLHPNMAIYASFVSCSNLPLIFLRNTVCIRHRAW